MTDYVTFIAKVFKMNGMSSGDWYAMVATGDVILPVPLEAYNESMDIAAKIKALQDRTTEMDVIEAFMKEG